MKSHSQAMVLNLQELLHLNPSCCHGHSLGMLSFIMSLFPLLSSPPVLAAYDGVKLYRRKECPLKQEAAALEWDWVRPCRDKFMCNMVLAIQYWCWGDNLVSALSYSSRLIIRESLSIMVIISLPVLVCKPKLPPVFPYSLPCSTLIFPERERKISVGDLNRKGSWIKVTFFVSKHGIFPCCFHLEYKC